MKPRNDRALALSAFCLEIERYRRTPEGRVRDAEAFLHFYFPRPGDGKAATDRLFVHLPQQIRGHIIAGWGIRGLKAAIRDDDERVKAVVLDALEAGDLDATTFEDGISPETVIDYVPLDEWWQFWRGAAVPNVAVQKALATARAMQLVDERWFLENVAARGGRLKATDAICDTLTKDDVIGWIRGIHDSGDGSPAGIVAARGWENMLGKTAPEALLVSLDAFARKVHLTPLRDSDQGAARAPTPPPRASTTPPASLPSPSPSEADAGWSDDPPQSLPGDAVSDDEIETVSDTHRPPPLPK